MKYDTHWGEPQNGAEAPSEIQLSINRDTRVIHGSHSHALFR